MALEITPRNYSMSDADLCMFVSNLCNNLTIDVAQLSLFGVTAPKIQELKDLGDAFEVYLSDDSYIGLIEIATRTKEEKAEEVRQLIRDNSARFELCFGVKSAEWDRLSIVNMNNFNDRELVFAGRRVVEVSTVYLARLADYGLTQDILDDMAATCESFELSLNDLMNTTNNRQAATKTRILNGNELYSLAVKYCEIGKRYWYSRDPVKYNQYIIYTETSPGTLTAPENFAFDLPSRMFSWNEVPNAVSYKLEISTDNLNWTEIYAGQDTYVVYEPTEEGLLHLKVYAHNAGGNGPETILDINWEFNLPAPDSISVSLSKPALHQVSMNWSAISGATFYRVFRSSVAIGAPVGTFTQVGEYSVTSYSGTQSTAMRHYFYIVAGNTTLLSPPSIETYIDVA